MRNLIGGSEINFMAKERFAMMVSGTLLLLAVLAILFRGLNFGVDFTGGFTIEAGFEKAPDLTEIRAALVAAELPEAQVQSFGSSTEVLIRMAPEASASAGGDAQTAQAHLSSAVLEALQSTSDGSVSMRRVDFVGPQVGEELREKGGLAILTSLFGIIVYIWFRFERTFSIGSVVALVHDVLITVGVFALFQIEFDLTILAAILAVIGYSLNDTIVVFDRIRENFLKLRDATPVQVLNKSINQTLTRTVITSMTTLMVLLALFVLGGKIISGFALALIIGVVIGTYSSIFVASLLVLKLGVTREALLPVVKEGADELDMMP